MGGFDGSCAILLVIAGGQEVQGGAVHFGFRVIREGDEPAVRNWGPLIAQRLCGAHSHRHQQRVFQHGGDRFGHLRIFPRALARRAARTYQGQFLRWQAAGATTPAWQAERCFGPRPVRVPRVKRAALKAAKPRGGACAAPSAHRTARRTSLQRQPKLAKSRASTRHTRAFCNRRSHAQKSSLVAGERVREGVRAAPEASPRLRNEALGRSLRSCALIWPQAGTTATCDAS